MRRHNSGIDCIQSAYKHIKRVKEKNSSLYFFYVVCSYIFYCPRFAETQLRKRLHTMHTAHRSDRPAGRQKRKTEAAAIGSLVSLFRAVRPAVHIVVERIHDGRVHRLELHAARLPDRDRVSNAQMGAGECGSQIVFHAMLVVRAGVLIRVACPAVRAVSRQVRVGAYVRAVEALQKLHALVVRVHAAIQVGEAGRALESVQRGPVIG